MCHSITGRAIRRNNLKILLKFNFEFNCAVIILICFFHYFESTNLCCITHSLMRKLENSISTVSKFFESISFIVPGNEVTFVKIDKILFKKCLKTSYGH